MSKRLVFSSALLSALVALAFLAAPPADAQVTPTFGEGGPREDPERDCGPGQELNPWGFCIPNPCPQPWGCFPVGNPPSPPDDEDEQPNPPGLMPDEEQAPAPPCANEKYNFQVYEIFADEHCPGWKNFRPHNPTVPERCRPGKPWAWIVSDAIDIQTTYRDCLHKCFSGVPGYEQYNGRCE